MTVEELLELKEDSFVAISKMDEIELAFHFKDACLIEQNFKDEAPKRKFNTTPENWLSKEDIEAALPKIDSDDNPIKKKKTKKTSVLEKSNELDAEFEKLTKDLNL